MRHNSTNPLFPTFSSLLGSHVLSGNPGLFTNTQFSDDDFVSVDALGFEVIEQTSALADELQEPPAGMMVFFVGFEMLGQISDSFAQ
jgi:hypothetical protein